MCNSYLNSYIPVTELWILNIVVYISCYTRKYLPMKSDHHGENSPEENCCQYLADFLTILVKVISDLGFNHYYFSHYQNNPSWEYSDILMIQLHNKLCSPYSNHLLYLGNYSHTQDIIGFDTSPEQCYDIIFPQFLPPF